MVNKDRSRYVPPFCLCPCLVWAVGAKEGASEDLPPMNLAFVIDHSGSIADADKLNWVKEAFDIFI